MVSAPVIVRNSLGLHARAANVLASVANEFIAKVELEDEFTGRRADAKSIMQLLMMAAGQGSKLVLHVDGSDQETAVKRIVDLFSNGFGESCE